MDLYEEALQLHEKHTGKISVESKVPCSSKKDLKLAYSPGVAEPCRAIALDPKNAYRYTTKGNLVAVVSDGSAVLGLGDIGALASLPVMEGKAVLFKVFAGVDGFPICLDTKDVDAIVDHVTAMAPTFGGINLEDIAAPRCFAIEDRLKEALDIPIFHDDQHGTAVVTLAGLFNALKLVNKTLDQLKVVILGAGAAGVAIAKILGSSGVEEIIVLDRYGAIHTGRDDLDASKQQLATITNPGQETGDLEAVIKGADVFIGVAAANLLSMDMVSSMAHDPVVFALANPDPEITWEEARSAGAKVVATGRSDYPNQVNNVLGFPGIFRGALDVEATDISEGMKIAAARAIAELVHEAELKDDYIIPSAFHPEVAPNVAAAVAQAAMNEGIARKEVTPETIRAHTARMTAHLGSGENPR